MAQPTAQVDMEGPRLGTWTSEMTSGPFIAAAPSLLDLFGIYLGDGEVGRGMFCPHRGQDQVLFGSETGPNNSSNVKPTYSTWKSLCWTCS